MPAINYGSQPTALTIEVEISQTELQMVMASETLAALVISIKETWKELQGTSGQPGSVSRNSTYKLGAEKKRYFISYVNIKLTL